MKLGRPRPGYHSARSITRAEMRVTGLPAKTVLFSSGDGVYFYYWCGPGLSSLYLSTEAHKAARRALDDFWED